MTYTEKVLAEFEETMIEDWLDADSHSNKLPAKFNFADCQLIGELLNPRLKSFLATSISQAVAEERARVVREIERRKKKVYTYEHTYPITLGITNAKGEYEETIKAGQKQIMTHQLDDEELIYNQALDDLLSSLHKPLTDKE